LREFRALVAKEPTLHAEYLKASDASEHALAQAIARRTAVDGLDLRSRVAAMVVGAERAAVIHWIRTEAHGPLVAIVRAAVDQSVAGIAKDT
jgi:hypothetical protein